MSSSSSSSSSAPQAPAGRRPETACSVAGRVAARSAWNALTAEEQRARWNVALTHRVTGKMMVSSPTYFLTRDEQKLSLFGLFSGGEHDMKARCLHAMFVNGRRRRGATPPREWREVINRATSVAVFMDFVDSDKRMLKFATSTSSGFHEWFSDKNSPLEGSLSRAMFAAMLDAVPIPPEPHGKES